MPYTLDFSLALGSSQTGLTLKAILVNSSGVTVGSEITTGFTEIGFGNYLWHYAAFPDGHRGGVKFYEGSLPAGLKAFVAINPEDGEYLSFLRFLVLFSGVVQSNSADYELEMEAATAPTLSGVLNNCIVVLIKPATRVVEVRTIVFNDHTTNELFVGFAPDGPPIWGNLPETGDLYAVLPATFANLDLSTLQTQIADAVWSQGIGTYTGLSAGHQLALAVEEATGAHTDTQQILDDLGGISDPLTNQVPGDYESGTAGAALGRIGVGSIKVTNALTPGGDLYLVKGDDYMVADGRAIEFTDAESEVKWPVLTDADVVIILQDTEIAGTVVTPTGAEKKVRFELTAEQTEVLSIDESRYAVVATLDGGNVVTLTRGRQFTYDNSSNA